MQQAIEVQPREGGNKGAARRLRRKGLVPGILYGHKEEPLGFAVDPKTLHRTVERSGYGRNTIFQVKGLAREVNALLKDAQVDRVSDEILHIDLIEVRDDEVVEVRVPLELEGRPAGVVAGGTLQTVRDSISLRCKPASIPRSIKVDVSAMGIGQSLHISDLKLPEGTESTQAAKLVVAAIHAPRVATAAAGEEGAAEGEAGEAAEG